MATEPVTPTTPLTAQRLRDAERQRLRTENLREDLRKLDDRHQKERQALSEELLELAFDRKVIQDQAWQGWINRSLQQEDGASASAAGATSNGQGERDEETQARLNKLLPVKTEQHVEVQHLLQLLDKEGLQKVYERRIQTEDKRKIEALQQTEADTRAGLWRFVSTKKVEAKRREVEQAGTAAEDIKLVDEELGYPTLPESYEEIKKLLDIEKNPVFSKALQEWNRKEELHTNRVDRKKNRVANLKNEVYQLIGFYTVFQGVLLTAVSQSSLLYCHNKWSPISLSVLASVISTLGVVQKLNQINPYQRSIDIEERDIKTAVQVGQLLRTPGPGGTDFVYLSAEIDRYSNRKLKKRQLAWLYFVSVILSLVAFGVLFPYSFYRILCKPGAPPPPAI